MPCDGYLFILFLSTESQKGQKKPCSSELPKKEHKTNKIATNFGCQQLTIVSDI